MKRTAFLFLFLIIQTIPAIAAEQRQPIMITINVVNHVKKNVELMVDRYSGYKLKIIRNMETSLKKRDYDNGKLLFIMPIGKSTVVDISYFPWFLKVDKKILCRLKIDSIDSKNAVITQVNTYNNSSIKCVYTGDPVNDTATINLMDND